MRSDRSGTRRTRESRDPVTKTPHGRHHHHHSDDHHHLHSNDHHTHHWLLGVTHGEERGRDPTRERREREGGVKEKERKEEEKLDG
ncbi:hypothetical protein Bca101_061563 [Brassica carinata]